MVAWRVAKCLNQLLDQVDAEAPHRSIASDGSIGNAEHQTRESDHNPWVGPVDGLMIVTARDFTHDPAGGFDAYEFAEALKAAKDPRVKYVISNWRIWSLARDREGWRKYAGPNGHTHHTHVSCTSSYPLFDRTTAWTITLPGHPAVTTPEDEMSEADVQRILDYQKACTIQIQNNTRQIVGNAVTAIKANQQTMAVAVNNFVRQTDAGSDQERAAAIHDALQASSTQLDKAIAELKATTAIAPDIPAAGAAQ